MIYIVLMTVLQVFAQPEKVGKANTSPNNYSMDSFLEKMRKEKGMNFVYSEDLIKDIRITPEKNSSPDKQELKNFFRKYGLDCRYFKSGYIVVFKNEPEPKVNFGRVEIKNIFKKESGGIREPQLISEAVPVYPRLAVLNKIEGKVRIRFLVTREGDVARAAVDSSSGSEILDRAALEYINKLKFIPAQYNGRFRDLWLNIQFNFYLTGKE